MLVLKLGEGVGEGEGGSFPLPYSPTYIAGCGVKILQFHHARHRALPCLAFAFALNCFRYLTLDW